MGRSRAIAIVAVLVLTVPPLMGLQWVLLRTAPRLAVAFPHVFHRNLCRLLRIRIRVDGTPRKGGPCLLASNHVSWLDIPVLSAVAPLSFISKSEVHAWPVFGSLARLQRSIFIDRERRSATARFRDEIQNRLALGDILVLFPEGTSSDGNRVLAFKSSLMGAADMAVPGCEAGTRVPVQPVSLAYAGLHGLPMGRRSRPYFAWYGDMDMLPHVWNALKRGPFEVVVRFHDPVTVDEMGNRKKLAAHCEHVVREGLVASLYGVSERA